MTEEEKEENPDQKCWQVETGNKEGRVCVITERCKGCEFCIDFCPTGALEQSDDTTEKGYHPPEMDEGCVLCGKCEKICPEFAIYLGEEEEDKDEEDEKEEEKEERGEWI